MEASGLAGDVGVEVVPVFRADVESFIPLEVVEAVTIPGRREQPPAPDVEYVGFLDFAGGSGTDSATLAVAHRDEERAVLDLIREVRPPFSPEQVCQDFARELERYRLRDATADRFAADFAREAMWRSGGTLKPSGKTKSDIYRELLPNLNSRRVELLDHPRLLPKDISVC